MTPAVSACVIGWVSIKTHSIMQKKFQFCPWVSATRELESLVTYHHEKNAQKNGESLF